MLNPAINIILNPSKIGVISILFASNLLTYIIDIVLIWALYILLKPINEKLALLAVFLRLMETACLAMGVTDELVTLRLLSNPTYSAMMWNQINSTRSQECFQF